MIDIPFKSGGTLPILAPDLTFPSAKSTDVSTHKVVVVPVAAGVKTTTLSLAGKWVINLLEYSSLIAEAMTHTLTIDGVEIWNSVGKSTTVESLFGALGTANKEEAMMCNSSLLLEVTTTTDTAVTLTYLARPIK